MRTFYLYFQYINILQTVSAESPRLIQLTKVFPLPWSAHVSLLSAKNPDASTFYEYALSEEIKRYTGWL